MSIGNDNLKKLQNIATTSSNVWIVISSQLISKLINTWLVSLRNLWTNCNVYMFDTMIKSNKFDLFSRTTLSYKSERLLSFCISIKIE